MPGTFSDGRNGYGFDSPPKKSRRRPCQVLPCVEPRVEPRAKPPTNPVSPRRREGGGREKLISTFAGEEFPVFPPPPTPRVPRQPQDQPDCAAPERDHGRRSGSFNHASPRCFLPSGRCGRPTDSPGSALPLRRTAAGPEKARQTAQPQLPPRPAAAFPTSPAHLTTFQRPRTCADRRPTSFFSTFGVGVRRAPFSSTRTFFSS